MAVSPADTILEMYPDTADTTSILSADSLRLSLNLRQK